MLKLFDLPKSVEALEREQEALRTALHAATDRADAAEQALQEARTAIRALEARQDGWEERLHQMEAAIRAAGSIAGSAGVAAEAANNAVEAANAAIATVHDRLDGLAERTTGNDEAREAVQQRLLKLEKRIEHLADDLQAGVTGLVARIEEAKRAGISR